LIISLTAGAHPCSERDDQRFRRLDLPMIVRLQLIPRSRATGQTPGLPHAPSEVVNTDDHGEGRAIRAVDEAMPMTSYRRPLNSIVSPRRGSGDPTGQCVS
jgi:hypothetical protein